VLRLSTGESVDLPLKATCKEIADELSGVTLHTNTIHFYQSDRTSNSVMPSDALRFKRLVEYVNVTKWRMLFLCARECMSDAIVEQVQREFPDHHFVDRFKLGLAEYLHPPELLEFLDWYCISEKHSIYSKRALQRCLDLASTHPHFEEVVAAACCDHDYLPPSDSFEEGVIFRPGTHMEVLKWNAEPWSVPSTADLDHMAGLLVHTEAVHDLEQRREADQYHRSDWNFSACAVAIDALSRLQSKTLKKVWSVVLHEGSPAVYGPECHVQGFIPLVEQYPRLRIERRVRGYQAAYLSRWGFSTSTSDLEQRRVQPAIFPSRLDPVARQRAEPLVERSDSQNLLPHLRE
jgi:hypothetical protein